MVRIKYGDWKITHLTTRHYLVSSFLLSVMMIEIIFLQCVNIQDLNVDSAWSTFVLIVYTNLSTIKQASLNIFIYTRSFDLRILDFFVIY